MKNATVWMTPQKGLKNAPSRVKICGAQDGSAMWRILAANHEGGFPYDGRQRSSHKISTRQKKVFFCPEKCRKFSRQDFFPPRKKVKNHKENGLFRLENDIFLTPAFSNFCFLSEKVKKMHDFWRHLHSKLATRMGSSKFDARFRHIVAPPCWKNLASNFDDPIILP